MPTDTETIHLEELCYLDVPCKCLFYYYGCCSQFDYKASVPLSGVLPAPFFKALIERRLCEPSKQTIPIMSTHFDNISWALTNLQPDSQLEV